MFIDILINKLLELLLNCIVLILNIILQFFKIYALLHQFKNREMILMQIPML